MDVLYSVKCDDDGWDLKMSLRTLERNGKNLGKVVLAGGPFPDWLSGDAVIVEVPSEYRRKQQNILRAMISSMERGAIDGPCLYSSDDHFMTRPCDLDDFPYFTRFGEGAQIPSEETYARQGIPLNAYRASICATRHLLQAHGLPTDMVSGHVNTHLDARDLGRVAALAGQYWETPFGFEPSTLFIAVARRWHGDGICLVPRRDVKIRQFQTLARMDAIELGGDGFLSCADSSKCGEFRKWMELRFPEPSRFEKR